MRHSIPTYVFGLLAGLLSSGCSTGYTKINGQWTYITINEAVGREVRKINADVATFEVLGDPFYARDKNHLYLEGNILNGFDGASFAFFPGNDFARDKNHVYFHDSIVLGADPATFRTLTYPYGKDAKNVYYGCLRMNVDHPEDFLVLKEGNHGSISSYFSTKELVEALGEEFADQPVLYEEKGKDQRYIVNIGDQGTATDGAWFYDGPKRSRPAQPATPKDKPK